MPIACGATEQKTLEGFGLKYVTRFDNRGREFKARIRNNTGLTDKAEAVL